MRWASTSVYVPVVGGAKALRRGAAGGAGGSDSK
jgi:hypothetical protein